MTITYGQPNPATAGGFLLSTGYPGQLADTAESVTDSRINNRQTYMVVGSADATAGALYGTSATLNTLVLSLKIGTAAYSSLTLSGTGNTATLAAFLAAIKAKTEWAGIDAQIGGPNGNQLVLTHASLITVNVVGTSTSNTALGLTAGATTMTGVASIEFGCAVAVSPLGDDYCQAPVVDDDRILGISVRNPYARAQGTDNTIDYKQAYAVPIALAGYIWVLAAESGKRSDTVMSLTQGNTTVPANGALGTLTGGAAGYGRVLVPNATWETTPVAGAVGKIRIWK